MRIIDTKECLSLDYEHSCWLDRAGKIHLHRYLSIEKGRCISQCHSSWSSVGTKHVEGGHPERRRGEEDPRGAVASLYVAGR